MSDLLEIRTLGGLQIAHDGHPLTLTSRKAEALLVYLACTARGHARDVLAEMLWPERDQEESLARLRVTLSRVRTPLAPYIAASRREIALNPQASIWVDAAELQAALAASGAGPEALIPDRAAAQRMDRALAAYQGDFLEGFYVRGCIAFDDWARWERERIRALVLDRLHMLATYYLDQGAFSDGIGLANRLRQIDPLREETYALLMALLARSGQQRAALDVYDACARMLREEFDSSPGQPTQALVEAIRSGELDEGTARPRAIAASAAGNGRTPAPVRLPPELSSFVGREPEIGELVAQLEAPDCRLITLVGPGGCGKTRLAIRVAEQAAGTFPDGVFFVDLVGLSAATAIPGAIAAALEFQFQPGPVSPGDQLTGFLADKQLLLVLDNFEHLVDGLDLVHDLLAAAPAVKVLATSRVILGLDWEWVYHVQGLPVPADDTLSSAADYSAIQLFVERARRAQLTFRLADNHRDVVRICQRVDGLPLGIELAAAWLRVMPCQDIADVLVTLEVDEDGFSDRHRSLQVVLDHTWTYLTEREQSLFSQLAVFQGGFKREAAENVADATLPMLAGLANKSLLVIDHGAGRYVIHRLLHEYGRDRLAEDAAAAAHRQRHAAYYARYVHSLEPHLSSERRDATLLAIEHDIDNIRAAWAWAVEHGDLELLGAALGGLSSFFGARGWYTEASATFGAALDALGALDDTPARAQLELALMLTLGSHLTALEGYASAELERIYARAHAISQQMGDAPQLGPALFGLWAYYAGRAEHDTGLVLGDQLIALADSQQNDEIRMAGHWALTATHAMIGNAQTSREHAEAALRLYDHARHAHMARLYAQEPDITWLSWLTNTLWLLGYPDQSLAVLDQGLALGKSRGHPFSLAVMMSQGLFVHEYRCDPQAALALAEETIALSVEHNLPWILYGLMYKGWALAELGECEAGLALLVQGISAYQQTGLQAFTAHHMALWAKALHKAGQIEEALARLDDGLSFTARANEHYYEPEIHRLRGDLLLAMGMDAEAEASFMTAIDVARTYGARSWELRATVSLARLWGRQGRAAAARDQLASLVVWFSEGHDTLDWQAAHTLLASL